MNLVFADTYYYLAFVNDQDSGHGEAIDFSQTYSGRTVTTEWVLTEVADALSKPMVRDIFLELHNQLLNNSELELFQPAMNYSIAG